MAIRLQPVKKVSVKSKQVMRVLVTAQKRTIVSHGVSFHGRTEGCYSTHLQQVTLCLLSLGVWNMMGLLAWHQCCSHGDCWSTVAPCNCSNRSPRALPHLPEEGRKERDVREGAICTRSHSLPSLFLWFGAYLGLQVCFSFPLNCPCVFKGCLLSVF